MFGDLGHNIWRRTRVVLIIFGILIAIKASAAGEIMKVAWHDLEVVFPFLHQHHSLPSVHFKP